MKRYRQIFFFNIYNKIKNMKKYVFLMSILLFTLFRVDAQNGILGSDFAYGWSNPSNVYSMGSSAGGSRIATRNAAGTGNRYWRFTRNWSGDNTEYAKTGGCADIDYTSSIGSAWDMSSCGSGAWYVNVASTSDNYVFKTYDGATGTKFVLFCVKGAIRSATSVTNSTVTVNSDVTVTATLDGSFSTGQGIYLRYTTDNWSTSSVVSMSGSGTSYTGTIPASVNTNCANISYYVFTSGNGLTISGANADFFTINLTAGSSYTIGSGCCPSHTCTRTMSSGSSTTVTAGETVCINSNYTSGTITLNGGTLFVESSGTIDYSNRVTLGSSASRTIVNCGVLNFTNTGDYDFGDGSSGNYFTIENWGTMTTSQASNKTFYVDNYNQLKNYGNMTFGGNLILRDDNALVNNNSGEIKVTTTLNIDRGVVNNYSTIDVRNLNPRNNASVQYNMYNESLTRVHADIWPDGSNKLYTPGGGPAYLNHVGGNATTYNSYTTSSGVYYCGPTNDTYDGNATRSTNCPFPLPVELLFFDCKYTSNGVLLKWATSTEYNNDYFMIERSTDAVNFIPIGYVNGSGNSNRYLEYSLLDQLNYNDVVYYRLSQTDYNGESEYFDIISYNDNRISKSNYMIRLFNNGNTDSKDIVINFYKYEYLPVKVSLYDMTSRLSYTYDIKDDIYFVIPDVRVGAYFLQICSDHKMINEKIIIRK